MRWIKWFAIDWINSTARDELNPDERGTWVDFVCLARFPGSEPGTFKISSWEALARKLNTPLSVILSTRDKCLFNRIKVEQNDEGIIIAILNWAKYQATGHDNTLWAKPAKTDNEMSDKSRVEKIIPHPTPQGVIPPDPRVSEVMKELKETRGYPSPRHPAEAKAVKDMLKTYDPEHIMACWKALKAEPFWEGKELFMMTIKAQIGAWKTKPRGRVPAKYQEGD